MIILVRQLKRAVRIDDITMYRKDLSILELVKLLVTQHAKLVWNTCLSRFIGLIDAHHILRSCQKSNWPKHWAERIYMTYDHAIIT
ncbi:unnamed protein product [Rhizophagus irregularis]|nr:unnamed protein product [Rhizophagus irregularis]